MLEVLVIMSLVQMIIWIPYRGKSLNQLSQKQQDRLQKQMDKFKNTKQGRQNPDMTIEEYLPVAQKSALTYMILFIVLLPIYIAFMFLVYFPK